jgi:uncharacterized membrane protein (DUF485 family)
MGNEQCRSLLQDRDFLDLCRRKNAVSAVLTVLTIAIYFGFIFLVAYGKDILSIKLDSGITVGIPIGIGVILVSWLFTGIYVLWANTSYDAMVGRIKDRIGG